MRTVFRFTLLILVLLAVGAVIVQRGVASDPVEARDVSVTTIDPPPLSPPTTDAADPQPTADEITAYFDALNQAAAWDFVARWWWSDLTSFVEAMEWAQAHPPVVAAPYAPKPASTPRVTVSRPAPVAAGGSAPGGFLACVRQRESGGNYSAYNPSGAAGAYQVMPGTWNGYGGYASAGQAPPAVQDQFAANLYQRAGASPWAGGQYAC